MPLYSFTCENCGGKIDELIKYSEKEKWLKDHRCSNCSGEFKQDIVMIAKTPMRWGDSMFPLNGFYSQALGKKVSNKREEERILNAKGFVRESELGKDVVERVTAKRIEETEKTDKFINKYTTALEKHGGDKVKAMVEAAPAKEILRGET